MSITDLVYLDTETTGLDPKIHDVWEVAYAIEGGPIVTHILPHSLKTADPVALKLNGYYNRSAWGVQITGGTGVPQPSTPVADLLVREALTGATIVGANPAFDAAFLSARWGYAPWHYRMVDIESYAMAVFGWVRPKGLKAITDELRGREWEIHEPDHTAAGDVETLRDAFVALTAMADTDTRNAVIYP